MPNTFLIRNLTPERSSQLTSHSMCLRDCLIDKYSSFTRIFVCLVKQTGDSDYFKNPFSKQTILSPKEKTGGIAAYEDWRRKRGFSQWRLYWGYLLRGLDFKPK